MRMKLASAGLIVVCTSGFAVGQDTAKKAQTKQSPSVNQKPVEKPNDTPSKTGSQPTKTPTATASAATAEMSPDEAAIRKTGETFEAAFNKGDAKVSAEHYTKDAEYVDSSGHIDRGRDAIEQALKNFFEQHSGSTIRTTINSIRMVSPGVAIEDGFTTIASPSVSDHTVTRYTAVHAKVDGKWLVASLRESAVKLQRQHQAKLKQLEWMTGEWVHEGNDAVVVFNCKLTENGNFLLRTFTVKVAGQEAISGTQRIGWDAQSDQFRSWIFDSDGGHSDGYWHQDGNSWVLKSIGVTGDGEPASSTSIYTFINPHTMTFQTTNHEVNGTRLPDSPLVNIVHHPPRPD